MTAYGFVKCPDSVFDIVFIKHIGYFCIMRFRQGDKEIIIPVFDYYINKILKSSLAVEDLAFSVNNIFLKIESHVFCYAEIFHGIRNNYPEFAANPEKVIDPGFACKKYCRKIKNIDLLLAEIL